MLFVLGRICGRFIWANNRQPYGSVPTGNPLENSVEQWSLEVGSDLTPNSEPRE
jgi:hypothetical protein